MAERNEIIAVYAAGVIQGVALVTFPAQYPTHLAYILTMDDSGIPR